MNNQGTFPPDEVCHPSFATSSSLNYPDWLGIYNRVLEWHALSDSGLRLRCGEMTAQEIRTVRAVLGAIIGGKS